MKLIEKTMR